MAVAANPVAGAKFFHFMMTTFLNHILGDGTAPGIFGNAAAHYGIVEAQDRGSLHCHMLIWLKGGLSPLQIQEKSQQNREWADKYLAWLEDVIKMDWPAILPGADGSGLVYSESPTMYLSPSPTDSDFDNIWPVYLRNLLQKTGQNHEHGHTCYKHLPKSLRALRDADKDCRFRLPRPLVPQSSFDEDGHVQLKCSNGMMNGYNDVVVSAMGCNMDCKAIGSGTAAMAMIHYITNYISKMGFDSGLVLAALAGSMKAMESSASQPAAASSSTEDANAASDESTLNVRNLDTSTQSRTRLLLLKTVNQMIGKRKLSGQQVSSYLCGNPNRYTALKFEKFYWGSLLRTVLPDFYPSYVPPEGVPSVSGQEGEAETDPLTVVRSENDSVTQNRAPSTLAEDYAWRHEDLKDITLWQFMSDYVKRPKPRSKSSQASPMLDGTIPHHPEQVDVEVDVDQLLREEAEGDREELVEQDEVMTTRSTWPFRCGHYAAESHVLRKRTTPVVPVLMGPGLPRRDREEELDKYQATMLLMFKPWSLQQSIQLKEQDETWKLAFDNFLAGTDPAVLRLMNNMQQMHECRDAKDDHSAQRKAREAALRGNTSIFADGLGDGDSNDDDEIWLAAMQTTATEPTEQRDSETYADALTQRAIDYAAVAGFYDVQETPDSAEDVVDHANVVAATSEDVERAERHLRALLKQKEDKIKQRTATAPASTRAFRPRMAAGTEGLPHATTWAAQVEAIRKKYEGIRFGNVPWRRLKDYQKTCLTLIELYTLNEEQTLAFLLICDNEGRRLGTSDVDPLGLLIGGPGGTGKSQIFMAVEDFFEICSAKHKLKLTAPTGVAASNIGGATIHSEASLRVPRLSMKTERLRTALEERWRSATTCVVDEVSFLGASDMALLNEYLKLAKGGRSDTYFGGLDMIFVGDMAQLPPPMSRALFDGYLSSVTNVNAGNDGERRALSGIAAFRSINKAVVLKQVMRQKDSSFVALLGRLRYGMCTREDKDLLDQYVLGSGSLARASNIDPSLWVTSPENASPLISYRNGVRDAHNDLMAKAFAQTSNQQFHYYHSEDKIGKGRAQRTLQNMAARAAWDVAAKKAGDLSGRLPLLMGMPVFCTENIATELGISNGSEGVVAGVSYSTSTGRRIAISADVDFPAYQNPDRAADFPHRVVLVPVKAPFTYSLPGSDAVYSATRWQLPLIPAFAYTCHNSQGRSLTTATIDLESASVAKDKTPLAYVMLSRLRSLEGLTILRPFPFAVISTHASHQVRTELKRVQDLASATSDWAKEKLSWYYDKRSDDSSV
ncbi:hypothetical protein CF319_g7667 [Tilletia indica]|nr:hypothetical protein CF319_g7667 [Tilletia indica]